MNYFEAMKSAREDGQAVSCWNLCEFVYWVPPNSYPAVSPVAKAWWGEGVLVPYAGYFAKQTWDGTVEAYFPTLGEIHEAKWKVVNPTVEQRRTHEAMQGKHDGNETASSARS